MYIYEPCAVIQVKCAVIHAKTFISNHAYKIDMCMLSLENSTLFKMVIHNYIVECDSTVDTGMPSIMNGWRSMSSLKESISILIVNGLRDDGAVWAVGD